MTLDAVPVPTGTVHLIDAHLTYPDWSEGDLNRRMLEIAREHLERRGLVVTSTEIEAGYDASVEVERYLAADLVIVQTPINWFGAPWTHKRYVDEVFNLGLHSKKLLDNDGRTRSDPSRQYGTGGHMKGRGFFISSTWTAPANAFDDPSAVLLQGKGADDVLLNISANYRFVGFTTLDNFAVHDIYHSGRDAVAERLREYPAHIDAQLSALGMPMTLRGARSRRGSQPVAH